MATTARGRCPETVQVKLEFAGILPTLLRPKLISEIFKLIFYQRQQIPLTYRDLKADVERMQVNGGVAGLQTNTLSKSDRLKVEFIKNMDQLSDSLAEAFNTFHPVQEVLILFGATLMSPNEVYHLRLPTEVLDGKILSERDCFQVLLRNLIGSDIFENVKETKSINKWTVLILAPRLAGFGETFAPKMTFKPPVKGQQFMLNFTCRGKVINPNISATDDLEMSGIEPLDNSTVNDVDMMETDPCEHGQNSVTDNEDTIWYEVKPSIKGFKL